MLLGDRIAWDCRQLERRALYYVPPRTSELLLSPDLLKQTLMSMCLAKEGQTGFSFLSNSSFQRTDSKKLNQLLRHHVITSFTRHLTIGHLTYFIIFKKSPLILFLCLKKNINLKPRFNWNVHFLTDVRMNGSRLRVKNRSYSK